MIIDLKKENEKENLCFKGGLGKAYINSVQDESVKILTIRLTPGSSIGEHRHEGNYEIMYLLEGTALLKEKDSETRLDPGSIHYCKDGDTHCIINDGKNDAVFFAVVPVSE